MEYFKLKKVHTLKTWDEYFEAIWLKQKKFEVRIDDREYKKGDILQLQEWDTKKEEYTGREMFCDVTYMLEGGEFGIEIQFCVMSIKVTRRIVESDLPF